MNPTLFELKKDVNYLASDTNDQSKTVPKFRAMSEFNPHLAIESKQDHVNRHPNLEPFSCIEVALHSRGGTSASLQSS